MTRPKTAFSVHTVHVTASLFAVLGREGAVAQLMRPPGAFETQIGQLSGRADTDTDADLTVGDSAIDLETAAIRVSVTVTHRMA